MKRHGDVKSAMPSNTILPATFVDRIPPTSNSEFRSFASCELGDLDQTHFADTWFVVTSAINQSCLPQIIVRTTWRFFPFFTKEETALNVPLIWLLIKFAFSVMQSGKPAIPSAGVADPSANMVVVTSANPRIAPALTEPYGFNMPGFIGISATTRSSACSTTANSIFPSMYI